MISPLDDLYGASNASGVSADDEELLRLQQMQQAAMGQYGRPPAESVYGMQPMMAAQNDIYQGERRGWPNRPGQRQIQRYPLPQQRGWDNRPAQRWEPQGGIISTQPQRQGWPNRPAERNIQRPVEQGNPSWGQKTAQPVKDPWGPEQQF